MGECCSFRRRALTDRRSGSRIFALRDAHVRPLTSAVGAHPRPISPRDGVARRLRKRQNSCMPGIFMRYAWLFAVLALAHAAHAQEKYPSRPVRLIVPF